MLKTQRLIIACLTLATGLGIGFLFAALFTFELDPIPTPVPVTYSVFQEQAEIYTGLKRELEAKEVKTDGLSPYLLLEHFPLIEEGDFDGVEAIVGQYQVIDGVLTYNTGETMTGTAASDMSEAGFALFVRKYTHRVGIDTASSTPEDIVRHMIQSEVDDLSDDTATSSTAFVSCTMDAKQCPDGSYVGRMGPDCEFAACPNEDVGSKPIPCTSEQKQAEACIEIYQPVCASVQIQCVTTPCEPIQKTYGNSCQACAEHSVTEYTEGECAA